MKAILTAKRYADTGFEIDVSFRENDDTIITTKTLSFSGADPNVSMATVKARVLLESQRLAAVQTVNAEPGAAIGTDLLA